MVIENFETWKNWLLAGLIGLLATGAASWAGWLTIGIMGKTSSQDVRAIVKQEIPHLQIQLDVLKDLNARMEGVIEKNTTAINQLTIEIAKMQGNGNGNRQ